MYFLYLLRCGDGTLYAGITTDLKRRFREHRQGKGGRYTRAKKAVKIIYTEKWASRSQASKREAEIKKLSRAQKVALIKK